MTKILKPYKLCRQKKESAKDAEEIMEFFSGIIKGASETGEILIASNGIERPEEIVRNTDNVTRQFMESQQDIENRGRRLYAIIYSLGKAEYEVDSLKDAFDMGKALLGKYPDYKSLIAATENENAYTIGAVFNNISEMTDKKMTQDFRPYHMSNIYNSMHKTANREQSGRCE